MARVVLKALAALFLLIVAFCDTEVLAQTHHVVGGDDGWSSDLNLSSWLVGRVFRVGDKIWFRYPAAEHTIAELKSLEEFVSCDITNPIRMYTDGLNEVTLENEGIRYFTSGNIQNCKNGMKLHVPVQPSPDEPAPPPQPEPFPPVQPEPPPQPEPFPPVQPEPPTQPGPWPPVQPEPPTPPEPWPPVQPPPTPPEPWPPVQPPPPTPPEPWPPVQPPPEPWPPIQPPPEPVPIEPPPATPPPPPSAASTPSNVLSFVYYGLLLSYFVL